MLFTVGLTFNFLSSYCLALSSLYTHWQDKYWKACIPCCQWHHCYYNCVNRDIHHVRRLELWEVTSSSQPDTGKMRCCRMDHLCVQSETKSAAKQTLTIIILFVRLYKVFIFINIFKLVLLYMLIPCFSFYFYVLFYGLWLENSLNVNCPG